MPLPRRKNWFFELFGVIEPAYGNVRGLFEMTERNGLVSLKSLSNGRSYQAGAFSTPSLRSLRQKNAALLSTERMVTIKHVVVGDILQHHAEPQYKHATFQAASQFNCLEFSHPEALPERGVTIYESDFTQGPACSIACGPATVYRDPYVTIRNGYTHATNKSLARLNADHTPASLEQAMEELKIGVQADTQVVFKDRNTTLDDPDQIVTQCFCSALSCGYTYGSLDAWSNVACAVLNASHCIAAVIHVNMCLKRCACNISRLLASYECTLWAALANADRHARADGANKVVLTMIGGGVFRNRDEWIADAIGRAAAKLRYSGLE
ncbi:uncharacterized protein MONBRDRAFT_29314, partial [Monosiga brevicollis MX1]